MANESTCHMTNEKLDLIDRNALKKKLQEHHDFFVDGVGGFRYLTPKDKARVDEITNCIAEVANAPTVDAVEVVRCKNCISGHKQIYGGLFRCNVMGCGGLKPDDFCSYGERKDND